MSERELTMDDYLAMLRRRLKVILIPTLIAPLTGFLVSYALPSQYQTHSTVLVEGQKVPDSYVAPVITSDFAQRVQSLEELVKSPSRLRPMLQSLGIVKPEDQTKLIADINQSLDVEPVITSMSAAVDAAPGAKARKSSATSEPVPGFNVIYTDTDAARAQKICNAMTSLIVDENLRSRSEVAQSTTDFLSRQVDDAKKSLDEQDAKLATFKKLHMGELPTDLDANLRELSLLNSQLDMDTQTISKAQQDKAYYDGLLAQAITNWKNSLSTNNPQALQQQLAQLQGQLMQLQARYTADYPDVMKTKNDIAEVEKRLKETTSAAPAGSADTAASTTETPEIQTLRLQIHQNQGVVERAEADQTKVLAQIRDYKRKTEMSPSVEEEYNQDVRDDANASRAFQDLLVKKSSAGLGTSMENQQEGEQMHIAATAPLPSDPSFPNRPLLAASGLGVGLALGALMAIFLEFSDKSIRTEKDAAAIMDLPLLISVPWLGEDSEEEGASANGNGNGAKRRFWGRGEPKDHEHVGV
jgi:uncharacterized protein involved in exopolysaccharide biosynthesis